MLLQPSVAFNHQKILSQQVATTTLQQPNIDMPIIKAKPLTIRKQPLSEQPRLRTIGSVSKLNGLITKKFEMPHPTSYPPSTESPSEKLSDTVASSGEKDKASEESENSNPASEETDFVREQPSEVIKRIKKGNLKQTGKTTLSRRVSFDPLALLLDASLEGELELVKKTATQVPNPSAANDEGITALHNAICAGKSTSRYLKVTISM